MESTIFYSWQSDLSPKINRNFIENALQKAAKSIRNDASIKAEPKIDQATRSVPGSPEIFNTILEKIENCDIFVCDVSIINSGTKARPCPNPNVLIELGYALRKLTWERIIMVFNKAFGDPKNDSPFDIPDRRLECYYLSAEMLSNPQKKEKERKLLEGIFLNSFRIYYTRQDETPITASHTIPDESLNPCDNIQTTSSNVRLYYYAHKKYDHILKLFPPESSKATTGNATASSQLLTYKPQNILAGNRLGIDWALNGGAGWYEVNWDKPIKGQYLLLHNRRSHPIRDSWGAAKILINGKEIAKLKYEFSGFMILLIDFDRMVTISKLHIDIEGVGNPGLSALEIY